jgi:hypothetical protein
MLLRMLRNALQRARGESDAVDLSALQLPLEEEKRLYEMHGRIPVDRHLDILYGDYKIGQAPFVEVYRRAMQETGTVFTPFTLFQRFDTRRQLCQYLFATLDVPGMRAECGVYRGATALLLCRAVATRQPGFDGRRMHLIDSFSGVSRSVTEDLIPTRNANGEVTMSEFFPEGRTDTSADLVRGFFAGEFPQVAVHAGWIPAVFASLPDSPWAYVHLDVSLYEPTLASLEYFYPRLSPGGVILCDGSIFCPGAEKAFRTYCERNRLAYAMLGYREYVLMNDAA